MAEAPTQLQLASEPESSSVTPNTTHDTATTQNQPQIQSSTHTHHQPSPPVPHAEPQASSLSPPLTDILTDDAPTTSATNPSSFSQAQHTLPAEAPVVPAPAAPESAPQALAPPPDTTYPPPSDDPSLQNPTSAELPPTSLAAGLAEHAAVDDILHHSALVENTTSSASPLPSDSLTTNGHISDHQQQPRQQTSGTEMSNPSYPPDPHRQSPSYGVQSQYSVPAMNNSYGYPNATGQRNEVYPSHPNSTNNSVPLPSMRTFDAVRQQHPQQQHQHHQQHQQPVMATPMPTAGSSVPSSVPYYQTLGNGNSYGLPPELGGPRYQLPTDPRSLLAGNRHKKEIKRRTKTGCLTCRKRRIKCDEAHPTCKNCQKSKRDCLGYDPIFKQQQQHPSSIQPAANNLTTSPQSSHHSTASPTSATFQTTALGTPIEAPMVPSAYPLQPSRKMKVEELVAMGGALPPTTDVPLTENEYMEIRELFDTVYAPGLESFFETKWYTSPSGLGTFLSNKSLNQMMHGFLRAVVKTDEAGRQYSANLEFRVVWEIAKLVKTADSKIHAGSTLPSPDDGSEARNRLGVIEVLLAGACLDQNPLMPPPAYGDHHRVREFRFWYYLGEFLRVQDQPGLNMTPRRDQVLGVLREVLDGRENRDVLYSFAVMRAYSPNFPADFESTLPPHLDETDPKSKLAVARKFVGDESQVGGGTTNVVRRFSELALRAFVAPGHNITRQ